VKAAREEVAASGCRAGGVGPGWSSARGGSAGRSRAAARRASLEKGASCRGGVVQHVRQRWGRQQSGAGEAAGSEAVNRGVAGEVAQEVREQTQVADPLGPRSARSGVSRAKRTYPSVGRCQTGRVQRGVQARPQAGSSVAARTGRTGGGRARRVHRRAVQLVKHRGSKS
jgi:hypothetical protein